MPVDFFPDTNDFFFMYLETMPFALSLHLTVVEETTKLAALDTSCAVVNQSFLH